MERARGWLVFLPLASCLAASPSLAGTISVTFSLTSGSGLWNSNQSSGQAITLGSGSVFLEIAGSGLVTATGSVATIQNLFATGIGPLANVHSLQLFGLAAPLIGTSPTGFTASAGGGTVAGSVGGPSGVFPLASFAAVLFSVSNLGTSGNATFRLLGGTFGGFTSAQVTQTFVGTEVSRTFVPEPSTGLLLVLGLWLAMASTYAATK